MTKQEVKHWDNYLRAMTGLGWQWDEATDTWARGDKTC